MSSEENGNSKQFQISTREWIIAFVLIALIGGPLAVSLYKSASKYSHKATGEYVGPKECAKCHLGQAASWNKTRMAKTFDVLRPGEKVKEKEMVGLDPQEDYTLDEGCLPCHTTGYGRVGGFVSIEETPDMAGVTCEACHGAGGMYVDNFMDTQGPTFRTSNARSQGLVYPPTARVCRGCHNEDSPFVDMNYQFDYSKMVAKGTHMHFALKYEHGK
jgi:hypothetical protein